MYIRCRQWLQVLPFMRTNRQVIFNLRRFLMGLLSTLLQVHFRLLAMDYLALNLVNFGFFCFLFF